MDSQRLKVILVVAFAAFAALYLGIAAATAQLEAIAWVAAALIVVFILALGKNVWALIPVSLVLAGYINFLPGNPMPWWCAAAVVGGMTVIRFLMHRTECFEFHFTWLDFAVLLQMVAVGQAFMRNPTGLSILGDDMVGGKPYFAFGLAAVGYFLLSIVKTDLKTMKWVVIFMVLAAIADGALMLASVFLPTLAALTLPIYSGASFGAAVTGESNTDVENTRLVGARELGESLGLAAFTIFRPLTTINPLYPLRFCMMVASLGGILLSGFRSTLGLLAIYAVVSSLIRRRTTDLLIGGFVAIPLLVLLIMTDSVQKLPYGVQRILSVLPVTVEAHISEGAESSSEWRFEMWKLALSSDRYIRDKWLGDGFGYRADELAAMMDSAFGDQRKMAGWNSMDAMMAKGSYHGFHVETIRMTGYFGLLCALIGMMIFFRHAWRQIQHFRGRDEWGFILYLCIPYLIYPFYFMLVFGAYRSNFPVVILAAGMIKILDNIRVRELAEAKTRQQVQEPSGTPVRGLPPNRHPQPAMKVR